MKVFLVEHLEQGSERWKQFRRKHIGGSDAPIIMGVSPWKKPLGLWKEKYLGEGCFVNDAMRRGAELEPVIRAEYERISGKQVYPAVVVHKHLHWLMASLDGMDLDEGCAVELKMANRVDHEGVRSGRVPVKYYPQLQHQMAATGFEEIDYFSYYEGEGLLLTVKRDANYIKDLLERERDFYKCLISGIPPEGSEVFDISDDLAWEKLVFEYINVKENLERAKAIEEDVRRDLIEMADGRDVRGCGVKVCKVERKGAVDYSKIPELNGVDLEKYRKKGEESWRITVS